MKSDKRDPGLTDDEELKSRIISFVPLDLDVKNLQIDLEIQERERANALAAMADSALLDLEVGRIIKGDVT